MTKENTVESIVEAVMTEAVETALVTEGLKPKVSVMVNGKEVKFGSREHIVDLKRLLVGLEKLKMCYAKGTANRHVYANSCTKIRHLIKKLLLDLEKKSGSKPTSSVPATSSSETPGKTES
jgi:hypothetical protein